MGNTPRSQCLSSRECLALCSYTVRNRTLFLPPASRERLWLLPGVAVLTLDPRGPGRASTGPKEGREGEEGGGWSREGRPAEASTFSQEWAV